MGSPASEILHRVLESSHTGLGSHALVSGASGHPEAAHLRACFELVLDGLTFDVVEIAAGQPAPDYMTRLVELAEADSLVLLPGPHLAPAAHSLPVVRGQWRVAARLCDMMAEVAAVGWAPSRTALPAGAFRQTADAWTSKGVFPPQGLVTFVPALGNACQSRGLAHFTGQELRIEPELAHDRDRAIRLGLRLAETLLHRGPLTEPEQFSDPAGGAVRLEPSPNRRFVRVWRG